MYMKQILGCVCLGLLIPYSAWASSIKGYYVDIQLNQDSTINVTEKVIYDFGEKTISGITRDIPLRFRPDSQANKQMMRVFDVSAKRNSIEEPTKFTNSNRIAHIKIGDGSASISGVQQYEISYTVRGALRYFDDYDELVWQAVSDDFHEPIEQFAASIRVPKQYRLSFADCTLVGKKSVGPCTTTSRIKGGYIAYYMHNNMLPNQTIDIRARLDLGLQVEKILFRMTWWEWILVVIGYVVFTTGTGYGIYWALQRYRTRNMST